MIVDNSQLHKQLNVSYTQCEQSCKSYMNCCEDMSFYTEICNNYVQSDFAAHCEHYTI